MAPDDSLQVETGRHRHGDDGPRESGRRRRGRVRDRLARLFSVRAFLLSVAASAAGLLLAGTVVPAVVPLGGLLGVAAAALAIGLWAEQRRYAETALAGATVAAAAVVTDYLLLAVLGGLGLSLAVLGTGAGAAAAALGHYLGRDLRAGITRSL